MLIKAFWSDPIPIECYSSGWRRLSVSSGENMLVSREPSFVYSKGKPVSSWLVSKSSNIFLYKSSFCTSDWWPVFCFALSSSHRRLRYAIRLQRAFINPPEPCGVFLGWIYALYFASKSQQPFTGIITLRRARTFLVTVTYIGRNSTLQVTRRGGAAKESASL